MRDHKLGPVLKYLQNCLEELKIRQEEYKSDVELRGVLEEKIETLLPLIALIKNEIEEKNENPSTSHLDAKRFSANSRKEN